MMNSYYGVQPSGRFPLGLTTVQRVLVVPIVLEIPPGTEGTAAAAATAMAAA